MADNQQQQQGDTSSSRGRHQHRSSGTGNSTRGQRTRANGSREPVLLSARETKTALSPYLSREEIEEGIARGTIVSGVFRVNAKNPHEGYVRRGNGLADVFVDGAENRNRAFDGDLVAALLFPESEWRLAKRKSGSDHIPHNEDGEEEEEGLSRSFASRLKLAQPASFELEKNNTLWFPTEGWTDAATPAPPSSSSNSGHHNNNLQPCGRIVGILLPGTKSPMNAERAEATTLVGRVKPLVLVAPGAPLPSDQTHALFVPTDARMPQMLVPRADLSFEFVQNPGGKADQLFEGEMESWEEGQPHPKGRVLRALGEATEIGPSTEAILINNEVDFSNFSEEVLDCLRAFLPPPQATGTASSIDNADTWWRIPEEEIRKRRDLRATCIVTVDPLTAKDIDDALHITPLADGTYEVGVHIADVSYFVRPDTAVNAEASRRCTSVYLVQKVVPMLPALLSEQLCSLNPGVDRLAFSCIWRMRANGDLVQNAPVFYGKTIIKSAAKLDYGLAQRLVDEGVEVKEWDPARLPCAPFTKTQVVDSVRLLHRLAMARRKTRYDPHTGGALELHASKMSFTLDPNTNNPIGLRKYPMHDTNRMVEEYMLLANYLVAQRLISGVGERAFLRHHPPPDVEKLKQVAGTLEMGLKRPLFKGESVSAGGIQQIIQDLKRMPGEKEAVEVALVTVTEMMKQPMKVAEYFVAGDFSRPEWRHWALNIPYYTHFTSPIRRYADVCVHRLLAEVVGAEAREPNSATTLEALGASAERCNERKEAARKAQEESDLLFLNIYVRSQAAKGESVKFEDGVVMDLGPNSFTVLLPTLGITKRVHAMYDWRVVKTTPERLAEPSPSGRAANSNARNEPSGNQSSPKRDDNKKRGGGGGGRQQQQQQQHNQRRDGEEVDEGRVVALRLTWPSGFTKEIRVLDRVAVVLEAKPNHVLPLDFVLRPGFDVGTLPERPPSNRTASSASSRSGKPNREGASRSGAGNAARQGGHAGGEKRKSSDKDGKKKQQQSKDKPKAGAA